MNRNRFLSPQVLGELCRQLAMLLKGGISLNQSLELLAEDGGSHAALFAALAQELDRGQTLADAMEAQGCFPGYMVATLRLGQEAGRLDDCFSSLGDHYRREDALRRTLRSAAGYPALMLGMLLVIVALLLTRVMPIFDQVFAQLGTRLTGLSRLLLDLGQGLRSRFGILLAVAAAVGLLIFFLLRSQERRSRLLRAVPWTRNLMEQVSLSRFAGALSLGLSSGLGAPQAMELASGLITDSHFRGRLDRVTAKMEEGQELLAALRGQAILTGAHNRLAVIGEKTGALDEALSAIAETAREEADRSLHSLIALIEPAMVLVLSVIVGVLLLSTLLPMLSILSAL